MADSAQRWKFTSIRQFNKHNAVLSHSVMSDFLQPHGLQPSRLLCPQGLSRQEYWSGLPCLSPGDLLNPGIEPGSPALQADSLPAELSGLAKDIFMLQKKKGVVRHSTGVKFEDHVLFPNLNLYLCLNTILILQFYHKKKLVAILLSMKLCVNKYNLKKKKSFTSLLIRGSQVLFEIRSHY